MKRINSIEVGIICGVLIAVATLFFADSLPSGSWLRAAFWPERIVVHGLGKIFSPHDQENIAIWLPVHFCIGVSLEVFWHLFAHGYFGDCTESRYDELG
jgi:hypothetical protein